MAQVKTSSAAREVSADVLNLNDCGRVAQLVEQCPFKAWVAGSSPAALTTAKSPTAYFNNITELLRAAETGRGGTGVSVSAAACASSNGAGPLSVV